MKDICINNNRFIGKSSPCFIIAELGINHNGDIKLAEKMIDAAKQAGADAIKVQNYITEDFVKDPNLNFTYQSQGKQIVETQFTLFKRCELNINDMNHLNQYCHKNDIYFMSTPTSEKTLNDLVDLQVPLLKNGSDFLRDLELIAKMASTKIPTILSTGMASLNEIHHAVETFKQHGGTDLFLLLCTSAYPTPAHEVNLRKIQTMELAFGLPIGFSDHTNGNAAAIASIAMGATIIEKHFTLDKNLPGPDHWFSADPNDLKQLVESVRFAENALGSPVLGYTPTESYSRENYSLSCVAGSDFPTGHVLKGTEIVFSRPGNGIPPRDKKYLIGRRLARDLKQGDLILQEDFCN